MTVDLVQFLRDRLDEDARMARPATPGPWTYNLGKQWHAPEDLAARANGEEFVRAGSLDNPICVAATGPADDPQSIADAIHIARQDPARALREVEGKRRIIDETWGGPDHDDMWRFHIQLLALTYADHPDYRQEWRP
ncbi:DUF6221 family protein [Streptomyces sp. NPDC051320]|uniref:DUF6221 family protein n=1 Tax=Streptomyces sp. NPDC051320 TaxID=3154644 RepID=UPI00342A689F